MLHHLPNVTDARALRRAGPLLPGGIGDNDADNSPVIVPTGTDLDYCSELATTDYAGPWPICPRNGDRTLVRTDTGTITTGRCLSNSCYACIWPVALPIGAAIGLAKPDWMIGLTQVGKDWAQIRDRVKYLGTVLRRAKLQIQYAWHVEPNPHSDDHHIHMWAHGDKVKAITLASAAGAVGMGQQVYVKAAASGTDGARNFTYGMKMCRPSRADASAMSPEAAQFLELNGGRLVHPTRGFWRDASGRPLKGIREAIRMARQAEGRGSWRLQDVS